MATRGRKPAKRVKIEIEMDMSDAAYREMKSNLKARIEATFADG